MDNLRTDFVLVWNAKSDVANSVAAREIRSVYEKNLQREDLILSTAQEEASGLTFIKIHAPDTVLKRYAEILNLRLPMKKVQVKLHRLPNVV